MISYRQNYEDCGYSFLYIFPKRNARHRRPRPVVGCCHLANLMACSRLFWKLHDNNYNRFSLHWWQTNTDYKHRNRHIRPETIPRSDQVPQRVYYDCVLYQDRVTSGRVTTEDDASAITLNCASVRVDTKALAVNTVSSSPPDCLCLSACCVCVWLEFTEFSDSNTVYL